MLEALYREEFPARRVYQLKRHGSPVNYFYFAFQRPSHTHQLYRFLYDAVEKEAYLERKHHVFREYFERVGCESLVTRFS